MFGGEKLLRRFAEHGVCCVLVGGYAAVIHGSAMVTQDIDLCIRFDEDTAARVLQALEGLHPRHRQNGRPLEETPASFARYKNLYFQTDAGPLDLLGQIKGIGTFDAVWNQSVGIELFGFSFRVLDLEPLIEAKRAMGRNKDKRTALELMAIRDRVKRS